LQRALLDPDGTFLLRRTQAEAVMPGGSGASAPPAIADEPLRGGTKIKGFSRANEGVLKAPRAGVRHALLRLSVRLKGDA
jgi:hypothetical protein